MIVTIVDSELRAGFEDKPIWVCCLEVENNGEVYPLDATAPAELGESELQGHFDEQAETLWRTAQQNQYAADVVEYLSERKLLKRLLKLLLNEINILRELHGLEPRTLEQLKRALKNG